MRLARAWHRAQVSISRDVGLGALALRVTGFGDRRPGHALPFVERHGEALRRGERLVAAVATLAVRPGNVIRAGTVARLARDVDLAPFRVERARLGVEVLPQVGRMAFGALEVPVLLHARPVQRIARLDVLPGIQVEPALPALRLRPRVPRDAERLQPAAGHFDQVLLQRAHTERVLDLVVGELAVGTVGIDEVLPVAVRERRRRARVREPGIREIAEHGLVVRDLHREIVVGALPRRVLLGVAARAGRGARVRRGRCRHGLRRRRRCASRGRAAQARRGRSPRRRSRLLRRSMPEWGAGAARAPRALPPKATALAPAPRRRSSPGARAASRASSSCGSSGVCAVGHSGIRLARMRNRIATSSCTCSAPARIE